MIKKPWVNYVTRDPHSREISVFLNAPYVFKDHHCDSREFDNMGAALRGTTRSHVVRADTLYAECRYENGCLQVRRTNSLEWEHVGRCSRKLAENIARTAFYCPLNK